MDKRQFLEKFDLFCRRSKLDHNVVPHLLGVLREGEVIQYLFSSNLFPETTNIAKIKYRNNVPGYLILTNFSILFFDPKLRKLLKEIDYLDIKNISYKKSLFQHFHFIESGSDFSLNFLISFAFSEEREDFTLIVNNNLVDLANDN